MEREEGVAGAVGARAQDTDTAERQDILLRDTERERGERGDDNCVDTHTTGGWKRGSREVRERKTLGKITIFRISISINSIITINGNTLTQHAGWVCMVWW